MVNLKCKKIFFAVNWQFLAKETKNIISIPIYYLESATCDM